MKRDRAVLFTAPEPRREEQNEFYKNALSTRKQIKIGRIRAGNVKSKFMKYVTLYGLVAAFIMYTWTKNLQNTPFGNVYITCGEAPRRERKLLYKQ